MKFSEQWLRDWVNPTVSTDEIVQQLTMAGLEVDSVEPAAAEFSKIVVGEVLSVAAHPDAEKLRVCQVNAGTEEALNIVCGAPNVAEGMRVPVALIGARLPNGMKIKKSKLRGVLSQGMLCSASELGMAESSDGLLPLASDAPIGEDVRSYLNLDDVCIDVDLTPNRGDCLSIAGIAREVGLLSRTALTPVAIDAVPAKIDETFPVELAAPEACPRYVGRIIRNIDIKATTPLWMQERLRRCGLRSISPTVDVTNYILLELGQPMHAFDFDKLSGGITVRYAQENESLTLLDEQQVELDSNTLVIADNEGALAMAGVMGGLASSVTDETQHIFLESAFFAPEHAAGCARRYGLHTDSSHRFERGVDPQLQRTALERATALLLEIVGGDASEVIEAHNEAHLPKKQAITLRDQRITRLLGQAFEAEEVTEILQRLGMDVSVNAEAKTWDVIPPSFRFDITIEADLIEELARVRGYNNLPSNAPQARLHMPRYADVNLSDLCAALTQRGYNEAITYSFVDPNLQEKVTPHLNSKALANPISNDMAVMRTSLWTGLLQATQYNQKRQQSRIRLFETGLRFIQHEDHLQQDKMIAGVVTGHNWAEQWGAKSQNIDFYDVKADIEAVLFTADKNKSYRFVAGEHPALHPGQTAAIYDGEQLIGYLGAIHPTLGQTLNLSPNTYLFELSLSPLLVKETPIFKEISKYPSIRRDLALAVEQSVRAGDLISCMQQAAGDLLTDLHVFDVYQGEGVETGQKSLAIGLIFQSHSRNLTESEVDTAIGQVLSALEESFNAQLRK